MATGRVPGVCDLAQVPGARLRLHGRAWDGAVTYTAHELRRVCASLMIASGATDMQVANQRGHSKVETTKNIYGHLFAQDRAFILKAINQAVSRLHAHENTDEGVA